MKNLLKITLLFAVFVLTKANVCGQTETEIYYNQPVIINTDNIEYDSIEIILNFRGADKNIFLIISINDKQYKSIILYKSKMETVLIKKGDKITIAKRDNVSDEAYVSYIYKRHETVGINENILTREVQLYSYDNNVVLVNQNSPKNLTVDIYTLTGQLVKTEQINGLYDKIDLQTNLPKGIYVVRVNDGINQLSKKLSINKGR